MVIVIDYNTDEIRRTPKSPKQTKTNAELDWSENAMPALQEVEISEPALKEEPAVIANITDIDSFLDQQ